MFNIENLNQLKRLDENAQDAMKAFWTFDKAVFKAGALDVLQKKDHPHVIKITPAVWDNTSDENIANLKKSYDPKLDPFYGVAFEVKPYTSYSMAQILACKGP